VRRVALALLTSVLMVSAASAQPAPTPTPPLPVPAPTPSPPLTPTPSPPLTPTPTPPLTMTPPPTTCIWAGRSFGEGATFCFAHKRALQCTKAKAPGWDLVEYEACEQPALPQ
jgi:hypothetical protein